MGRGRDEIITKGRGWGLEGVTCGVGGRGFEVNGAFGYMMMIL